MKRRKAKAPDPTFVERVARAIKLGLNLRFAIWPSSEDYQEAARAAIKAMGR